MKILKYIFGFIVVVLSYNCTNVSEENLIDNTPPPDFVNFDEDIQIIFENNCWQCHGNVPTNGATTSLVSYDQGVFGVQNNNVIERISATPGFNPMPIGTTGLPSNLVDLIRLWEEEGFLESP